MHKVSKKVLPNGIRLITIPRAESLGVTVLVLVRAGLLTEKKATNGISHFIEHMCFKGTKKWPTPIELAREFESLGAIYNAFTSEEFTGYYATVLPKHTERAIDILADMYLHPIYDEKEIDKERGVIKEEIKLYEDRPNSHVWAIFANLLYGDQPAGWEIIGTRENIDRLSVKDFHKYRQELYQGAGTLVVVAGNFDAKKMGQLASRAFAEVARAKKEKKLGQRVPLARERLAVKYRDIAQSHFVLGFPAVDIFHKDTYAINVLAKILGGGMSSRLFQTIREQMGAAYHVSAYNEARTNHGFFSIYAGVHADRAAEAVAAALKECARLTTEVVSPLELRLAKDSLISGLELSLETSDAQASFYAAGEILKKELLSPEQMAKKIEAVTAADIKRVAKKIFRPAEARLAVLGPHRDNQLFVKALGK